MVELIALFIFRAVGKKRDARLFNAQSDLGVHAAHDSELHQIDRLAIGIRARIQQKHLFSRFQRG